MKLSQNRSVKEKGDEPVLHHVIKNDKQTVTKQDKSDGKCLYENLIPPSLISFESKHKHGSAKDLSKTFQKEKKSDKIIASTRNHKLKLKNKTASFPEATANIQLKKTSEKCSSAKSATRRLTKPIKRRYSNTGNDSALNMDNPEKRVS